MKKTPVTIDSNHFPSIFSPLLTGTPVYDSSCSADAKVYFIDTDGGYYLKIATKGSLENEAKMTRYFHSKGLSAEVLAYEQNEKDWLLTRRIPGADCIHAQYLANPKWLCDTTATLLRQLHETDHTGCPIPHRTENYLETVSHNYRMEHYDTSLFPDNWGYRSAEEAWNVVQSVAPYLKEDTLLHGDYCLPNILLDNGQFSGFIDLGCGGVGDRHIDIFWGVWTLQFNLKTDAYGERFLDAYGRDRINPEILKSIGAFEVFG